MRPGLLLRMLRRQPGLRAMSRVAAGALAGTGSTALQCIPWLTFSGHKGLGSASRYHRRERTITHVFTTRPETHLELHYVEQGAKGGVHLPHSLTQRVLQGMARWQGKNFMQRTITAYQIPNNYRLKRNYTAIQL